MPQQPQRGQGMPPCCRLLSAHASVWGSVRQQRTTALRLAASSGMLAVSHLGSNAQSWMLTDGWHKARVGLHHQAARGSDRGVGGHFGVSGAGHPQRLDLVVQIGALVAQAKAPTLGLA